MNDPLYNHVVFGPEKGKNGNIGKTDEELIHDLISIHNAENWLGGEGDDFAPNFFSTAIPSETANVATPASSSDSVGLASGVSSRSQTPDIAPAKDDPVAVLPPASDADRAVLSNEINTTSVASADSNCAEGSRPSSDANASMPSKTEESATTGSVIIGKNESKMDEAALPTEDNSPKKDLETVAVKLEDGQFSFIASNNY